MIIVLPKGGCNRTVHLAQDYIDTEQAPENDEDTDAGDGAYTLNDVNYFRPLPDADALA